MYSKITTFCRLKSKDSPYTWTQNLYFILTRLKNSTSGKNTKLVLMILVYCNKKTNHNGLTNHFTTISQRHIVHPPAGVEDLTATKPQSQNQCQESVLTTQREPGSLTKISRAPRDLPLLPETKNQSLASKALTQTSWGAWKDITDHLS